MIIPAIDLKDGQCVRLTQGRSTEATVYSSDPVAMAKQFEAAGVSRLHLVDLDGAFEGQSKNRAVIESIVQTISIPVQLGGGLRSLEAMESCFSLGVSSVIIGTLAVKQPDVLETALKKFPGEQILLGIDARSEKVAIEGWETVTELDSIEFGRHWKARGVERVVLTDIARDGMLGGPDLEGLRRFAEETGLKVVASGGVSCVDDLKQLKQLTSVGVDRAIVGKAFYEGAVTLEDMLHAS